MKQKLVLFLLAAILSGSTMAQNSIVSKIVNGPSFESLSVTGPVSVELIESEICSIEAIGDYDFINGISTSWSKKQLRISFSRNEQGKNATIKVYVKSLTDIIVDGGARVITSRPLHCGNIKITISGDSYARIINYGGIHVESEENFSVSSFNYKP